MDMRITEPFSWGYIHAGREDKDYRTAFGMKTFSEVVELEINTEEWFQSPVGKFSSLAVHYSRGDGIELNESVRNKNAEKLTELKELEELNFYYDYFRPYETTRIISKVRTPLQEKLEINKCAWAAGGGHSNPDYEFLLRIGTDGIRERIDLFRQVHTDKNDFYDGLLLCVEALETAAARYKALADEKVKSASGEEKEILIKISDAFSNIPQKRPRSFFEACQFFWLSFSLFDIDSPGLFDYALGAYYEDTEEDYLCLQKLWELFRKTRTWNLAVGRSDEFGNDRTNKLTYAVLRLAKEKKYNTPNITFRVNKNTPADLWELALDTLSTGIGMPAIYNDKAVCTALEAIGIPPSDSHLYCMNGCNQIDIFGKSHMGLEDGEISVPKALEFALFRGECQFSKEKLGLDTGDPESFSSFEELMSAYKKQIEYLADYITDTSNKAQEIFAFEAPNPWKSIMVQGCIEKGLDYKNRGPVYGHGQVLTEGLPDTADSLAAIKHFIYDEKKYTMGQLISALKNSFKGFDELYNDFKNYDKFGNDIEEVDGIYSEITDHIYRYFQTKKTFRGGVFGVGCSTFHRAPDYGYHLGALPNGKKNEEKLLADSIGATPGNDVNGPTALLKSVMKGNQYLATSGNVLQMKFSKAQFVSPEGRNAFTAIVKTYFRNGGQTLQINVLSREDLINAKKCPDEYKNLIVRVGGFSEYFTRLAEPLQDNIIKRTEN
ncbi:MAG: hypothetical protein E7535_07960 [Ruminococcaceae bacterium]|nr:hypothetical protein [Oscillospiraceae bacterium]